MAFTVEDFEDLQRLLAEHPEWRAQLRPLILGDEFLQVPERLNRIDERLDRISETLDRMAARQDQFDQRLLSVDGTLGQFEGKFLELKYFQQFRSWFGKYVRGAQQVIVDDLEAVDQALRDGVVTQDQVDRLWDLDFLVRGRSKSTQEETLLAVEISKTVRMDDVLRAHERAQTLRRAGYVATGFVGGILIEEFAQMRALELDVLVDLHPSWAA